MILKTHKTFGRIRDLMSRYSDCIMPLGLMLVLWIALLPVLTSGYFGDDVINSYAKGVRLFDGMTLFGLTSHYFKGWVTSQGRFFPFAWYVYWLFETCNSLFLYKLFSVISILITSLTFGYFIFRLTHDRDLSFIFIILLSVLFQCRIYHDPLLSFQYLMQVVLLETVLSLIFLVNYLEGKRLYDFVLSCFFFLSSLLTYEITYVFFIFHFIVAIKYASRFRERLRITAPYILLSALSILVSVYLRSKATAIDPTYQINFNLWVYLKTLLTQIASGLPLIYYISNPSHISVYNPITIMRGIGVYDFIGTVSFFILFYSSLIRLNTSLASRHLAALGLAFMVVPGLMIALSVKHQKMHFGLGYLPVFLQYFGVALVVLQFVLWSLGKAGNAVSRKKNAVVLSCFFTVAYLINLQNNWRVVEVINSKNLYPRQVLEHALQNGLLLDVPQYSTILIETANVWDNKYFIYQYSGKKMNVFNSGEMGDYKSEVAAQGKDAAGIYLLKYDSRSLRDGYVLLGRYRYELKAPARAPLLRLESLKVYSDNRSPKCLLSNPAAGMPEMFISRLVPVKTRESDFYLTEAPVSGKDFNFNSLKVLNCK